ncbi:hypothetical protein Tco_0688777 [Tanacetum coccineum]
MGLWYPKGSGFELTLSECRSWPDPYTRKSTSGGIQFLAEAEYVALSASCAQVMWMRTQLQDLASNYNKNRCNGRLSVTIAIMQPRAALPYQAYPYSVSLHKGTG